VESGAELLALPGEIFATFSPDGRGIHTWSADLRSSIIYDSRPVNRTFVERTVALPRGSNRSRFVALGR